MQVSRVVPLGPRAVVAGLALAVVAACGGSGGPGASHARAPDCKIEVLPNPPGDGYVRVGEMDFPGQVMFKRKYQYTSPYTLANNMRQQICAAGGDTLVADRNAAGEITHATVFRHIDESDIPAPYTKQPPPKAETCEAGCGPGFTCDHDACVPQAQASPCEPACGDGQTCGADRLCHPAE
ncbi:MAG TPA: hypothetical protein VHT91_05315 [Kofleriaceae bacterium]|nr:hypothetical protein [Kofleriaceae bacterium]